MEPVERSEFTRELSELCRKHKLGLTSEKGIYLYILDIPEDFMFDFATTSNDELILA
jgi:hypothetical protein